MRHMLFHKNRRKRSDEKMGAENPIVYEVMIVCHDVTIQPEPIDTMTVEALKLETLTEGGTIQ